MSRPEKPIDWDRVDELIMAGCPATEISPFFDMHPDTFCRRFEQYNGICFTVYSQQKRCQGEANIRETQYLEALAKNTTMLVWLGKQRLGQKEPEKNTDTLDPEKLKPFIEMFQAMNRAMSLQTNAPQPPVSPTSEQTRNE